MRGKIYSFKRSVPGPIELLSDDKSVIARMPDNMKVGLEERLSRIKADDYIDGYVRRVAAGFGMLVQQGSLTDQGEIKTIAESAVSAAYSWWGLDFTPTVRVISSDDILEAEHECAARLERESGKRFAMPIRPSPSFADHLDRSIVVSDRYVLLRPRDDTHSGGTYAPHYFGGESDVIVMPWDVSVLRTIVNDSASLIAIRGLRGESGDGYVRMFRAFDGNVLMGIDGVTSAACSYALPRIEVDGGVAVLQRNVLNVWSDVGSQMYYAAYSALSQDLGPRVVCLFDSFFIEPGSALSGPVIHGILLESHPAHAKKEKAIKDSTRNLSYPTSVRNGAF